MDRLEKRKSNSCDDKPHTEAVHKMNGTTQVVDVGDEVRLFIAVSVLLTGRI